MEEGEGFVFFRARNEEIEEFMGKC